jgi:hypothetical protein
MPKTDCPHCKIPELIQTNTPAFWDWAMSFVSYEEAARLRGCSVETIRSEVERGALPAVNISERRKAVRRYVALGLSLSTGAADVR